MCSDYVDLMISMITMPTCVFGAALQFFPAALETGLVQSSHLSGTGSQFHVQQGHSLPTETELHMNRAKHA